VTSGETCGLTSVKQERDFLTQRVRAAAGPVFRLELISAPAPPRSWPRADPLPSGPFLAPARLRLKPEQSRQANGWRALERKTEKKKKKKIFPSCLNSAGLGNCALPFCLVPS